VILGVSAENLGDPVPPGDIERNDPVVRPPPPFDRDHSLTGYRRAAAFETGYMPFGAHRAASPTWKPVVCGGCLQSAVAGISPRFRWMVTVYDRRHATGEPLTREDTRLADSRSGGGEEQSEQHIRWHRAQRQPNTNLGRSPRGAVRDHTAEAVHTSEA